MKVLFTATRLPYHPFRGDTLITYHRIRQLVQRHEVTLLSFVETRQELDRVSEMAPYCAEIQTVLLPKWRSYTGAAWRSYRRVPLQVLYYQSAEYNRKLQQLLARHRYDVVHTVLSRGALHTIDAKVPVKVVEMIDALSLTMQRIARTEPYPSRLFFQMEAARMRRLEQLICSRFDHVLVVSKVDQQHLGAPNVSVIPAGAELPQPRPARNGRPPTVIFSGNLMAWGTRDAVWFVVKDLWPAVRQAVPGARLRIVGLGPPPKLVRMARSMPDVEVTGYVPDLTPYFHEADVALCPVRTAGAGLKRKALEAMACGVPVVATPDVSGVEGRAGEDILFARDVPEYVNAIRDVLTQPKLAERLSVNGRRLVAEEYSWEAATRQLEQLYEDLLQGRRQVARDAHRN